MDEGQSRHICHLVYTMHDTRCATCASWITEMHHIEFTVMSAQRAIRLEDVQMTYVCLDM